MSVPTSVGPTPSKKNSVLLGIRLSDTSETSNWTAGCCQREKGWQVPVTVPNFFWIRTPQFFSGIRSAIGSLQFGSAKPCTFTWPTRTEHARAQHVNKNAKTSVCANREVRREGSCFTCMAIVNVLRACPPSVRQNRCICRSSWGTSLGKTILGKVFFNNDLFWIFF